MEPRAQAELQSEAMDKDMSAVKNNIKLEDVCRTKTENDTFYKFLMFLSVDSNTPTMLLLSNFAGKCSQWRSSKNESTLPV